MADAATGQLIRRYDTATNPHLDSTGSRFGRRVVRDGRSSSCPGSRSDTHCAIVTVETATRARVRITEWTSPQPTWSTTGKDAFTAVVGGLTDLFAYDLTANTLQRLTTDAFAEVQPAWSPDGRSIAFSTDRFSTSLQNLDTGNMRLAVMDVTSRDVRPVGGFEDGKNINPQWSTDGRSLYFISDRQGISNVYSVDLQGSAPAQVTNLLTGMSGITG